MRCSWAENSTGYSIMSAEDSPDSVWSEAADARCNGRPVSSDSSLRPSVTLANAVGPQLPQEGPPQSTHDRLRTDATIAGDAPSADSSARQTSSNIRFEISLVLAPKEGFEPEPTRLIAVEDDDES